ncbi:TetR family transcriptional regulator [Aeromicrobium sp. A1-2]|uniref:TetR/AcrR family transcriptional regulator n=1 Tax=Aeromicrobium sp. A1-2 TaxID=2107713 RepID=UPI000E4D1B5B|nr:TetR/AcrR family transcriptional regulator [Aeromicrobium sp. A1-2]AXT85823.1 TetR family transcriptional regulator [Aeromicrobium sp. A1-2]
MAHGATLGRPRDPGMEHRVERAACRVYGRQGWAGFSIDAVAREAGVGKASIYLRWSDKKSLLTDALVATLIRVDEVDSGSLRGDLETLARHHVGYYVGDLKNAALRMTTEAPMTPELRPTWEAWRESQVRTARATVRRGIARGELAADASVTLLLDTLFGAALMHALVTPDELSLHSESDIDDYACALADFVLAAASLPARVNRLT